MSNDCIFCKIIQGKIPNNPVFETDLIFVIKDIAPKAPIHYLIIPKKHLEDLRSLSSGDQALAGELLMTAKKLSQMHENIPFRLLVNSGHDAGQRIYHLHLHFLAGKKLSE